MIKAANTMGLIFFPAYDWAISPSHPEREERLLYTQDQLWEEGIFDIEGIDEYKPDIADPEDVARLHFCFPDVKSVTTESHMISAGGALRAARLVMDGEKERAFALVRPPGHHAMKAVHGNRGFCNINNEAIMAEYIRDNYPVKKIAIVDTDCHHGDGTQDIYWHDPDVLYISIHQDGRTLYPGSGHLDEDGGPNARGRTVNIPLPPRTSDEGFLMAIKEIVLPILEDFKPDIIINSAGQDNHYSDPITNMNFSARGYAELNDLLKPDIAVLEGGYSIQGALPYVNLGIILAMAGVDYSYVREPDYSKNYIKQSAETTEFIKRLIKPALNVYFKPSSSDLKAGTYDVRIKNVYYDTDGIQERQKESVRVCDECAGLLIIDSQSSRCASCLGIEIPFNACPACSKEGLDFYEKERKAGNYRYIHFINRPERRIIRR